MAPLSTAERQRRWRQKQKAARNVSDRHPRAMTKQEREAEIAMLASVLRSGLTRLVPMANRLQALYRHEGKKKMVRFLGGVEETLSHLD
jgi:hypothetical protein